jgi:hypothetical protein
MKEMPKNITYLLGAGASAYAIPVMKNLPKSMKYFFETLVYFLRENSEFTKDIELKKTQFDMLLDEINRFGTPDIVAKIAFHKGEEEKLEDLKNLLSCYMLYEQMESDIKGPIDQIAFDQDSKHLTELREVIFSKDDDLGKYMISHKLDNRYVEFLSAIMKGEGDKISLADNVNIVSWNYDHQLEKAFNVFYPKTVSKIQEHFGIFPITGFMDNLLNYDAKVAEVKECRIIKLNGTAGFSSQDYRRLRIDVNTHTLDHPTLGLLGKRIFGYRTDQFETNKLAFAWENDTDRARLCIETARSKIQMSDVVVVIGYSFPNFNRQIDRQIFEGFEGSKIYVQDLYPDEIIEKLDGVKASLKSTLHPGLKPGLKELAIPVKSSGAFTLPSEFWE